MNKTKIEWCDRTWNPVTGCLHECEYCYARRIAKRFGTLDRDEAGEGLEFVLDTPERFYELNEPVRDSEGKISIQLCITTGWMNPSARQSLKLSLYAVWPIYSGTGCRIVG